MFPRPVQPILDEFLARRLSEPEFLKRSGWERVWGFSYELYRGLITWARDNGIRILGLNAPPEVVRKIGREGLSALSSQEKKSIARELDIQDQEHRKLIEQEYRHHPKGTGGQFQFFYEAQVAWEETMAETLAEALATTPNSTRFMVAAGNGHIENRRGIPMRTRRRTNHVYKTVITLPAGSPVQLPDARLADYVWIITPAEPPHRGRLGVMVRSAPSGRGVEVLDVITGSPAAKAGLRNQDVLLEVDGTPVDTLEDLHRVFTSGSHQRRLKVLREGKTLAVTVELAR
jgi:uncharacterized iron-regulated protein